MKKSQTVPKWDPTPYVKPGLSEAEVLSIKESFDIFDPKHTGSINPLEIKQCLDGLGVEVRSKTIYQLICDFSAEGNGNITFEQFVHLLSKRVYEGDSRENIRYLFALFDDQKSGFISLKSLRRIVKQLGVDLEEADLQDMIRKADLDQDGLVSQQQFYHLVSTSKF